MLDSGRSSKDNNCSFHNLWNGSMKWRDLQRMSRERVFLLYDKTLEKVAPMRPNSPATSELIDPGTIGVLF